MGDWELVVVDDASEDTTWRWVTELSARDRRVHIGRLARKSERSAARNRGLAEARGEFVLFLDDDDRLFPDALQALASALGRHREAYAAVGARVAFDDHGCRRRIRHPRRTVRRAIWRELLAWWIPVPGQCLFRRAAIVAVGGWNERLVALEDQELWLRLSMSGPVVISPQSVLEYRVHDQQWRPRDLVEVEGSLRAEWISSLTDSLRDRAAVVMEARRLMQVAREHLRDGRTLTALCVSVKAMWTAPFLVSSPLTRMEATGIAVRALMAAVIGPTMVGVVRKAKAKCRRILKLDVGATGKGLAHQGSALYK
jgi:hypothetical protein